MAGLTIPDSVFHVTISVVGISILGLLAYTYPTALFLVPLIPLAITWLLALLITFAFTLQMIPEVERSLQENVQIWTLAFFSAMEKSINFIPMILSPVAPDILTFIPRAIWELPHFFRGKEIEAIEEKVYTFALEDLLYE